MIRQDTTWYTVLYRFIQYICHVARSSMSLLSEQLFLSAALSSLLPPAPLAAGALQQRWKSKPSCKGRFDNKSPSNQCSDIRFFEQKTTFDDSADLCIWVFLLLVLQYFACLLAARLGHLPAKGGNISAAEKNTCRILTKSLSTSAKSCPLSEFSWKLHQSSPLDFPRIQTPKHLLPASFLAKRSVLEVATFST